MRATAYLLAGPLIWLATLLLLRLQGARHCMADGAVMAVQLAGVLGCVAVLYRALAQARRLSVEDPLRLRHFIAGGSAVFGLAAIAATALATSLMAVC